MQVMNPPINKAKNNHLQTLKVTSALQDKTWDKS